MKRIKKSLYWLIPLILVLLLASLALLKYFGHFPMKTYTAAHFGIETAVSSVDFDGDEIDDYADLLSGAKLDAIRHPRYDGSYYKGGYPPEEIGVCTDVVWRAFREAGYSLKEMVDWDIAQNPDRYPQIAEPDPNIDFRRVQNLLIFFKTYAKELTTDIQKIDQWQPGDIVVFNGTKHIGIVSNLRNKQGQPYIIHNGGQPVREENYLPRAKVTAHFRFDAGIIKEDILFAY